MYTADWNSIKLSAAYTYTWMESAALSGGFEAGFCDLPGSIDERAFSSTCFQDQNSLHEGKLHQIGGSIMHKPSGLGIFGQYTREETGGSYSIFVLRRRPPRRVLTRMSSPSTILRPTPGTSSPSGGRSGP